MKKQRHPDDIIADGTAIVEAAERFRAWKIDRAKALEALVLTYSDNEAHQLFLVLREEFWSL